MAKNENKTRENDGDVDAFLAGVEHERRRLDAQAVCAMMRRVTGLEPKMWGASIVGFGDYHYKYDSGREGDFFRVGLSPRKQSLTIYIVPGFSAYDGLLSKLGKFKTSRSCLYVNKLADIDAGVLEKLVRKSFDDMNKKYPV